jgi:hypothetical protein
MRFFKTILASVTVGIFSFGAHATHVMDSAKVGKTMCYSRAYTPTHLRSHPGQSLQEITLETDGENFVLLQGISASDQKTYEFWGDQKMGHGFFCASFTADGDQDQGCVRFTPYRGGLLIRPIALKYASAEESMEADGVTLIRCEGQTSDGEGCEQGKFHSIQVSPKNHGDRAYFVMPVACPVGQR